MLTDYDTVKSQLDRAGQKLSEAQDEYSQLLDYVDTVSDEFVAKRQQYEAQSQSELCAIKNELATVRDEQEERIEACRIEYQIQLQRMQKPDPNPETIRQLQQQVKELQGQISQLS